MARLFKFLGFYKKPLSQGALASISNKILDLMPPLLVGWAVDAAYKRPPQWLQESLGTTDNWRIIFIIGIAAFFIFAGESFFEWVYQRIFMNTAQRIQHDLRMKTYHKLQNRELSFFENNRTGNMMAMLNDDVNQLERFLNDSFNQVIQLITLFIFATIVLCGINWQLTLLGIIPIPLILIGSFLYQKLISPRYKRIRESVGKLSSRLENNISGILVVKSFSAEKFEGSRVEAASMEYQNANRSAIKVISAYIPVIRIFIAIGFSLVIIVGGKWALEGSNGFTAGHLTTFAMMIQRLLWPITGLGRVFDDFERAKASARRIFGLLDDESKLKDSATAKAMDSLDGDIRFDSVSFHYKKDLPILEKLDFSMPAGSSLGIVGTTGAGKTTLIKLLLRLYDVNAGGIKIDGTDIREIRQQDLRRNIALVSQDVYLFHGTIRENIAYGMDGISDELIIAAAKRAELHSFVSSLPEGYDSLVGERGIKLSGGQRQRLSIARAILKDAPILILDEATSAVDVETEQSIQRNLEELSRGRTTLVIAHRLSTIRNADNIIVIEHGKIVEQGNHETLIAKKAIYNDLWKIQTGLASLDI